ncbi:MAG: hypothetical protein ACE5H9_01770 [Anaerolineae bacterium]
MLKEVLAAHADQMLKDNENSEQLLELFPQETDLAPLLDVAAKVKSTLKPARPSTAFEKTLRQDLMAAAHLRQAGGYPSRQTGQLELIFSALVIATLALAFGILVAYRRFWPRRAAAPAVVNQKAPQLG